MDDRCTMVWVYECAGPIVYATTAPEARDAITPSSAPTGKSYRIFRDFADFVFRAWLMNKGSHLAVERAILD